MPQISVRMPDEMAADLDTRGERADTIRESLERYFYLLAKGRASLREKLTENEMALIIDNENGTINSAPHIPVVWYNVEDGINLNGLDEKWNIDGPALLDKLKNLQIHECFALVDAAERYWEANTKGDAPERFLDALK